MALKNIKPAPLPPPARARITDPGTIRLALVTAGVHVGPDPGRDGDWAARVEYQGGDRSIPEIVELVGFSTIVKAVTRGTPERGRLAWIDGDRLVLEGDEDDED